MATITPVVDLHADTLTSAMEKGGVDEKIPEIPAPPVEIEDKDEPKEDISIRKAVPLVLTLTGAAFLNTASVQAIVIILPTIGRHLNVPPSRQQWMVSAYPLTFGCFLLLFGKLGDVFGKRLLFILGGIWVTGSAVATGFSPNEICFAVMRALQGLGAAANVPTAIGIIGTTIPPGRTKNYAFAFYSSGAPIGSLMGNLIAGIISQYASWKAVFFVIAGCSLAISLCGILIIPKDIKNIEVTRITLALRIDWLGAFLVTSGLLLLIVGLSEGNVPSEGWKAPMVPAFIVVGLVLIAGFICYEHYLETKSTREPLMPVSIFGNKRFSIGMGVTLFFYCAFNNFLIYATYFFQDYLLLSPIETTIRFIPTGAFGLITSIFSGFLLDRVAANHILSFGITSACISILLFAVPIPPTTTYMAYGFPAMCLIVIGADTVYPCLGLFLTQSLKGKDQALAGAMFNTVGQIGRAIGLAVASAIDGAVVLDQTTKTTAQEALLRGLRSAQWFSFGCGLVALMLTFWGLREIGKVGLAKKSGAVHATAVKGNEA